MGWRNSPCWHSNGLGNMVSVLAYSHHGRLTWLACRPTARTARAAGLQPGRLALPAYSQDGSPCRPTARTARPAGLQPGRLALPTYSQDGSPCRPTARTARPAGLQQGQLALPAYSQDGSPCWQTDVGMGWTMGLTYNRTHKVKTQCPHCRQSFA